MRTTLITELRQNGVTLKRQEQPSRSFVEGLFVMLYLAHAQIPAASPYFHKDVRGGLQGLDCQASRYGLYQKGNLAIAAPSGSAQILCTPGLGGAAVTSIYAHREHFLPGEHIGIQAGTGDTAIDTTDFQLANRVHHGQRAAVGVSAIIEQCDVAVAAEETVYSDDWYGQVFIPYRGHEIDKVDLKLWQNGTPGTLTVEIRAVGLDSNPVGPVLASGTLDGTTITGDSRATASWETITLGVPVWLYPGLKYAIVCHGTGTTGLNCINWCYNTPNPYLKGGMTESGDAGDTWTGESGTEDMLFREYGTA